MISKDERFVITFNGEIYNHSTIRSELNSAQGGVAWAGHSDTEVLLEGFRFWGVEKTLRRASGMFAFGLWDRQDQKLILSRDRFGEKPLYFGWIGTSFAFASELSAFHALEGWNPRIDAKVAGKFLSAGYVSGPHSIISGIYRLPPASIAVVSASTFDDNSGKEAQNIVQKRYWDTPGPLESVRETISDSRATDRVLDSLRASVAETMMADVPLGAFLSGGIDSSLVVALMQEQAASSVSTFSVGFREPQFDEAPYARAVAEHLRTNHNEHYVGADDALSVVTELPSIFDEPFADTSQIPTLLLARYARHKVKVVLTGDGGDELFGGYSRYSICLRILANQSWIPDGLKPALVRSLKHAQRAALRIAYRKPLLASVAFRTSRLAGRLSALEPTALNLSYIGAGPLALNDKASETYQVSQRSPDPALSALREMMHCDQLGYLPDDILVKVDRTTMSVGLEGRAPFLGHELAALSWQLQDADLLDHRGGKRVLREALSRYLPREMFERPKQGFSPPLGGWLRGALRSWAEPLLSEEALRSLPGVDHSSARDLWRAHLAGHVDAEYALWPVLMYSAWRDRVGAH